MSPDRKICIVGAGPGGLYAAMRLAQLGLPTLVLERATFPRPKVCGDILTSNVIRALHDLDPALVAQLLEQPWTMELRETAFGSAKKAGFVMPFHSPANERLGLPSCLSAKRIDFDDFLYRRAMQEPLIDIRQNCPVRQVTKTPTGFSLSTTQGSFEANYLLIAAGANSQLVQDLVPHHSILPKHSAVGMQFYFQNAAPHPRHGLSEFYLFDRRFMPGGLYITPFADGSVNVNAVMRLDIFQKTRPKLSDLMKTYLQDHPQLQERFAGANVEGPAAGCTLFFGTKRRPLSAGNCLLIGDAAGLTDATNANGIGHAMISGGIAAEKVAMAMEKSSAIEGYDTAVYARLQNALRPGKIMKALFGNRLTAGISASMLNASLNRFNGRAVEELVYSSNAATTLLSPRFYWRLFAKE